MLPLLERIVGHLERVRRVAEKEVVDREVPLDYDRFEAFVLLELLDPSPTRESWRWEPVYLRAFVQELHWGLLDGIGAQSTSEERFGLIERALAYASNVEELESLPRVPARLLPSLVEATEAKLGTSADPLAFEPWNVADYCDHLGLTVASTSDGIGAAGKVLIELRGRDRLRWLLALETSLATSHHDSWCIDLDSVRALASGRRYEYAEGPYVRTVSDAAIVRWTKLGALEDADETPYEMGSYRVTPVGREIFGELARDEATSFRILIRALLEDDRERILARVTNTEPLPDRATVATLRHARMVAHEVRNTLGPIQYALKKIWASPVMAAADLSEPRQWIDEGLARLHQFVDDSLRLVPIAADEATTFSVMDVIDEARRQCVPGPERGIQIATLPASADPRCRGHRGRLVVALLNLLRNAVQVGATTIRVSVDARKPRAVTIRVHDDGPGIPPVQWDALFANGVSHRDGGSGHGLSFVRLVIEQEMRGRVQPIPPPDGVGACFELELTTEEEAK